MNLNMLKIRFWFEKSSQVTQAITSGMRRVKWWHQTCHWPVALEKNALRGSLTFTVEKVDRSGKARMSHYSRFTTSLSFIGEGAVIKSIKENSLIFPCSEKEPKYWGIVTTELCNWNPCLAVLKSSPKQKKCPSFVLEISSAISRLINKACCSDSVAIFTPFFGKSHWQK